MDADELSDDDWPNSRATGSDPPVISSVHGAYHAVIRRLDAATRPHGLEGSEALVLAFLLRDPGCSPSEVRHRLGFHRSTLSSLLDRLERDGLIHRASNAYDRRRLEIRLTAAGRIGADTAELVIAHVEAELATYMSPVERRGARAVFEACVAIGRPNRGAWS